MGHRRVLDSFRGPAAATLAAKTEADLLATHPRRQPGLTGTPTLTSADRFVAYQSVGGHVR